MGVNTRAYITNLTLDTLSKFMKVFDSNARLKDVEMYKGEMYCIFFLDRQMTIHVTDLDMKKAKMKAEKNNWNVEETDEWLAVKQDGLEPNTHGLSLSLGANEEAFYYIKLICLYFGGYYKKEDTADGPYRWIDKDWHKTTEQTFL